MKRLYILVEGQTEEAFVKAVLAPYLAEQQVLDVRPMCIPTGPRQRGGFVNYQHLKNKAEKILKKEREVIVSMLVDFYGCPETPGKDYWENLNTHQDQVEERERQIAKDMQSERFIPYIQLHEFEALLFSSMQGFEGLFDSTQCQALLAVHDSFPCPEDINTSAEGFPSKRLKSIVPHYDKVLHGELLASEIGIQVMLNRCPRFAAWVERLIEACQ